MARKRNILLIGGIDPTGGAGLSADLRALQSVGVYGMPIVATVTCQNEGSRFEAENINGEFIRGMIRCADESYRVDAVKSGMLMSKGAADALCEYLEEKGGVPYVMDPVMKITATAEVNGCNNKDSMLRLMRYATVCTPNVKEAEWLTGIEIDSKERVREACEAIMDFGAKCVVIKGADAWATENDKKEIYGGKGKVRDYVCVGKGEIKEILYDRVETRHTHGSGCTFASYIAAFLGKGADVEEAVRKAERMTQRAVAKGAEYAREEGKGGVMAMEVSDKMDYGI